MRVLIMILILMDYVKKDTTFELPCWLHPLCFACVFSCKNDGTCIPDHENYTCECQTGKTCDQESSTTVVSSTSQTDSTPEESTTTFTPSATSTNETTTTMMSTSSEGISTASSMEPATASTKHYSAATTNVAEIFFNSSTNGSTRAITSPTISSSTTEAEPSTRSEEATTSPFLEEDKKSVPVSVIAGSIGGIVLIALLTIGLVILFRKRKRRKAKEQDEMSKNNIHCNPAYDEQCAPSAHNLSSSSKDSGFGKHDESVEAEMMDGEYNTLRLHFPATNEPKDNTYNHIEGSLTANSTYSHIPNSKDALFDNTYSHMSNVTNDESFEPQDIDTTYNHLGDSCSSKGKSKREESRDETYNHAQMNHVRPTADQADQDNNYSHINLSGLKAQMPNADEQRVDAQEPTLKNAEYANAKHVTKIVDKGKKQKSDAGKNSTAEGENEYEGHTYFVLESNTEQHPKQARYDYAVAAAPEKDHTQFTVLETDTQHEYFVLEPTTELQ